MPASIREAPFVTSRVTTEDHTHGWKKQKESISSDPDGLTFSHYKAGATEDLITQFDATLRSLPYQHGFTPAAWLPMTDVEILKKAGVYDVEKMRTILLMNAEFNMNNKKLGRDMMHHAERHGALAREQYGSRRNHQCILAALNKRLTMDLLRQTRRAGALCANDAKSCYDRIVHNIATLCMRRLGMPKNPIHSMFATLQSASHKIRTAYGVSDKTYGPGRDPPLQGIGQGNGAGPAGWAVISTPLINMMRTAGFGFSLFTALTVSAVSFVCYAFVDDTDLVHTAKDVHTRGPEILTEMQRALDHWEGGLKATGGALVPEKSYWYLIDFIWTGEKWRYATKIDIPGDISINNVDDSGRDTLRRFEANIAKETLGVFLAMDGNNKEETHHLRKKAVAFADCIRTGFLTREDATYALHRTIMKTLEYPIVATTMDKAQWDYIMAPLLAATLPRMGYVQSFPRDIVYSPEDLCGLGIFHPWHNQHLSQLKVVLQETALPSITGDLIRASFEQLRLEIGLPDRSDQWNWSVVKSIATDCWLKDLLQYAAQHNLYVEDTLPVLTQYRTHDQFLMTAFINNGYRKKHLQILNECRKVLQVNTLSEITSADGAYLESWAWTGSGDHVSLNDYQWPRPAPLQQRHWQIWQQAVQSTFLHVSQTRERKLRQSLGEWMPEVCARWKWFYCPNENRIYHREDTGWRVYSKQPSRVQRLRSLRFVRSEIIENELPDGVDTMATVSSSPTVIKITGTCAVTPATGMLPVPVPIQESLEEALDATDTADRWAVESVSIKDNGRSLAAAILQGKARAVSDGSFKNAMGTSSSILFHSRANDPNRIISVNAVPGNANEQSAYRSELAGVSGSLAITAAVCRIHDIQEGSITLGLDGQQALLAAAGDWPLNPERPDFDLITDIRTKLKKLPISVKWKWVEGHQDDDKSTHLDEWAKANILVDNMAKAYWNHLNHGDHTPAPQRFGDEAWALHYQGNKLNRLDKAALYHAIMEPTAKEYWRHRGQLQAEDIANIDWELIGSAFQSLTHAKQRRVTKHAAGHFGCGTKMKLWRFQDHSECPRCPEPIEDPQHILNCPALSARACWNTALTTLEGWMTKHHTMPELTVAIIRSLKAWRSPPAHPINRSTTARYGLQRALLEQDTIGWYSFLMGKVSIRWQAVQQKYFEWLKRRNTGKAWVKALILKVWQISWSMWDHRNDVRLNTTSPSDRRAIEDFNRKIREEFSLGLDGIGHRDQHWFAKPLAHVLEYDKEHKAQWLASVDLARYRFTYRAEFAASSISQQRETMEAWLGQIRTHAHD